MPHNNYSRRDFFRRAATATALGAAAPSDSQPLPKQAWIIVALGWEYNDEFSYPEGEHPVGKVYFSPTEAAAECRRFCDEFFQSQTPAEFEADFVLYLGDRACSFDFDDRLVTWDQLRAAGFPDPYSVQQMEVGHE